MAYGLVPLINGKLHEFADIVVNVLGIPLTGIRGINYTETQNMENVWAAGNKVGGRVYKEFVPEGNITLLMTEVEQLQAAAPGGKIQAIPEFNITVSYVDASYVPRTHILKGCRFMSNGRTANQGDGAIEVEIKLIIADIQWTA